MLRALVCRWTEWDLPRRGLGFVTADSSVGIPQGGLRHGPTSLQSAPSQPKRASDAHAATATASADWSTTAPPPSASASHAAHTTTASTSVSAARRRSLVIWHIGDCRGWASVWAALRAVDRAGAQEGCRCQRGYHHRRPADASTRHITPATSAPRSQDETGEDDGRRH